MSAPPLLYEGKWALVTGASRGLGEAFARLLAFEGANLVLTARTETDLKRVADLVKRVYHTETITVAADLGTEEGCVKVIRAIEDAGVNIDILINNAGFGNCGEISKLPWESEDALIGLNVRTMMRFCRHFAPGMVQRGWGRILNIGTVASVAPLANLGTYTASKAFINYYTQALWSELQGKGVHVNVLAPGFIRTNFQKAMGFKEHLIPGPLWQQPDWVAQKGLRAVERNQPMRVVGAFYIFLSIAAWFLPPQLIAWASGPIARRMGTPKYDAEEPGEEREVG